MQHNRSSKHKVINNSLYSSVCGAPWSEQLLDFVALTKFGWACATRKQLYEDTLWPITMFWWNHWAQMGGLFWTGPAHPHHRRSKHSAQRDSGSGSRRSGMDAQRLARCATAARSGRVVGPIRPTRRSLGAFVGVGGSGSGSGFLLLRGLASLSQRRCWDGGRLKTPTGLHDGIYDYSRKHKTQHLKNTKLTFQGRKNIFKLSACKMLGPII